MIGAKVRYNKRLYLVTEEEDYRDTLDFSEVFEEFAQCFEIIIPGESFRDFSIGGQMFYLPPKEVRKTGVILPLNADDLQFDKGGTHTYQSIKIFMETVGGFVLYRARRIDEEEKSIIACYLRIPAVVGDTVLQVDDPEGFITSMKARILEGTEGVVTTAEYITVEAIGDKTISISPLKNPYSKGACILEVGNV